LELKLFFAGGVDTTDAASPLIDIYDDSTTSWTSRNLSAPRFYIGAVSLGSLAIFYSGSVGMIDIYNSQTNSWSQEGALSRTEAGYATTAAQAIFLGGYVNGAILDNGDIFSTLSQSFSNDTLVINNTVVDLTGATLNGKAYFAGGTSDGATPLPIVFIISDAFQLTSTIVPTTAVPTTAVPTTAVPQTTPPVVTTSPKTNYVTTSPVTTALPANGPNATAIALGIIIPLLVIGGIIAGVAFFYWRRRQSVKNTHLANIEKELNEKDSPVG